MSDPPTVAATFERVRTTHPEKSFRDCWAEFAYWEEARNYGDDPGKRSKDTIDWIYQLEAARTRLAEFQGPARDACAEAIDRAFEAFARLEHPQELVDAVALWAETVG